jgi:hypothetical protein
VHGLPSGLTNTFPDVTIVTQNALTPLGLPEAEAAAIALLATALSADRAARMDPASGGPHWPSPLAT